ncbi:sensor histidine kinase [Enterococcus hirae]|uniref:sensor histidine kinase n=1 Tax=Enterococcus hirae TaxID=1354 RepID=UPI0025735D7A|nr:histidine kinase [Enterococcus hirae]
MTLRNNGNIQVFYKNKPIPPEIKPKYVLDQRQAEHYVVTATTKYANVFTEYSLIYTVYSFFAILVFLGFFPFLFQYLQKIEGRLSQLTQKITKVKTGNFDPEKFAQSDDYKSDDAISLISSSIDELAYQLNDQIHQVYKSKIKQKDYQIQSIRSQINPHFLYNTLEAIRMKAELNEDHAVAGMLLNAATLYRKLIKGKDVICLAEELEYCDAYLSLFEIRFEDALFYDIVCDPSLESLLIEKFTIQPIIENFIHHGIDSQRQDNFIEIHCFEKDDRLYIEVVNNGKPIPKVEKQRIQKQLAQNSHDLEMTAPTGLFGVDYRIKQRFGHQYGVTFTTQEDYVKFQITMPKKRGGEIV